MRFYLSIAFVEIAMGGIVTRVARRENRCYYAIFTFLRNEMMLRYEKPLEASILLTHRHYSSKDS